MGNPHDGGYFALQDDFFLPNDHPSHRPSNIPTHHNWDIISAVDMDAMVREVEAILSTPGHYESKEKERKVEKVDITTEATPANSNDFSKNKAQTAPREVSDTKPVNIGKFFSKKEDLMASLEIVESNPSTDCDGFSVPTKKSRVLLLEGFSLLDDPRIVSLLHLSYFLDIPKDLCISRRSARSYDPPDPPGYVEACVWPMFLLYRQKWAVGSGDEGGKMKVLSGEEPLQQLCDRVQGDMRQNLSCDVKIQGEEDRSTGDV